MPFDNLVYLVHLVNPGLCLANYELYADMSNRVMTILSGFAPETEVYSIDEMFLDFSGMDLLNPPLGGRGTLIVSTVERGTGIPVCLGIAPTKTLAKLANRFAKKFPAYNRVCIIDSAVKTEKALKLTEVGDVWGIGHRYADKLTKQGVETAFDFTRLPKNWVRKNMTIVGERIWLELQGESCLTLDSLNSLPLGEGWGGAKKQICTSRSFGKPVTELGDLSAAVAGFAESCAYKLRKQKSVACSLMVFVSTNWFNKDLPQYHNSKHITLPLPTSSTTEIVHFAQTVLERIYRPGYQFKKAGVIITEILPSPCGEGSGVRSGIQGNLFYQKDFSKHNRLMKAIDKINDTTDRDMVKVAAAFGSGPQDMQRNSLSPRYSTRLQDIITIKS